MLGEICCCLCIVSDHAIKQTNCMSWLRSMGRGKRRLKFVRKKWLLGVGLAKGLATSTVCGMTASNVTETSRAQRRNSALLYPGNSGSTASEFQSCPTTWAASNATLNVEKMSHSKCVTQHALKLPYSPSLAAALRREVPSRGPRIGRGTSAASPKSSTAGSPWTRTPSARRSSTARPSRISVDHLSWSR